MRWPRAGYCVPRIGGPSVKPYQPPKIWETVAMDQATRGLQSAIQAMPLPAQHVYILEAQRAAAFDGHLQCSFARRTALVRRERTNTPLQALVTMNDPQFVEAARVSGAKRDYLQARKDLDGEIDYMADRLWPAV